MPDSLRDYILQVLDNYARGGYLLSETDLLQEVKALGFKGSRKELVAEAQEMGEQGLIHVEDSKWLDTIVVGEKGFNRDSETVYSHHSPGVEELFEAERGLMLPKEKFSPESQFLQSMTGNKEGFK